ncbi:MAG: hypothetical protein RMI43_05370 [Candidatus Caldarchaeum sp.]|nr:hypothetical protein [Candidatus Caldarchaeum sp.]MCX8200815.1 hypothetical protein [Candidatus Caldarchaeum sp.]MDW8063580.1 hypothetical protein [Candidatus Caldarchaeum sp.]MDW8434797.1 hypothetical protein [Candidatus Caldarchaeum sp.]
MCIFRIGRGRKYFCGKRYPLPCSHHVCPFGEFLWHGLVNRDYRSSHYWLMPSMTHVESVEEAWRGLSSGEAEYVVKEIVYRVGERFGTRVRKSSGPREVS